MEEDPAYNKKSLEELHNRINKILAQLPEITGRADHYSRASVCATKTGKKHCDIAEDDSVGDQKCPEVSETKSRKTSTSKSRIETNKKLSDESLRETPTKDLLSGRRGRNKMYRKRPRSSRKLRRSKTEVEEIPPDMTPFSDVTSETCGNLSIEKVLKEHSQKMKPVEHSSNSLAQSFKKLQKHSIDIPNFDSPNVFAGSHEKSSELVDSKHVHRADLESSEESLDENDAHLYTTSKMAPKDEKSTRDNHSSRKFSGLYKNSTDQHEEIEPNKNSAVFNQHEHFESAAEEKSLIEHPNFQEASNERAVASLDQSFDESMPKEVRDNSPQALFTCFITSSELKEILLNFRFLCKALKVQTSFCRSRTFRLIQSSLPNADLWPKLWKCLGEKSKMTVYGRQAICMNKNVLIVGAGPCGLRAAIECALLGARVVLTEKRPDFSRTNCVYLWSFVIEDLISLGANHVGGRFSTSRSSESTDNVYPIATIQVVLTKIALLLGVTIVTSCEFLDIIYPSSEFDSYRVLCKTFKHSRFSTYEDFKLQNYFFRTLICASGQSIALPELFSEKSNTKKSNTAGFGITANFVKPVKGQDRSGNKEDKVGGLKRSNSTLLRSSSNKDEVETDRALASCRSTSKVNHSLRAELNKDENGNDVYEEVSVKQPANSTQKEGYTHNFKMAIEKGFFHQTVMHYDLDKLYFIMTVNASILKNCGAIEHNFEDDKNKTMSPNNINVKAMTDYITAAANYATHGRYFPLQFALNKKGEADFSLFYSSPNVTANHAGKIIKRFGQKLLVILVGDSLIHPFWKTGSGLAKGFMSVLDAAWVLRSWSEDTSGEKPLSLLALQESLYLFLRDLKSSAIKSYDTCFCMDPSSRYKSLAGLPIVKMDAVRSLLDVEEMGPPTSLGVAEKGSRVVLPKLQQHRKGNFKGVDDTHNFSIFNLLKKLKPSEET